MWILWNITLKSSVLPLEGSIELGLWHTTQYFTSVRAPPCQASTWWQFLQVWSSTISPRRDVRDRAGRRLERVDGAVRRDRGAR